MLVLLHGRNGRKEDLLPVAERFAAAGFRCVLPDLPAHGDHLQSPIQYATGASEKGFANRVLLDARGFLSNRNNGKDIDDNNAGIWRMSLGGAYAIEAAASKPENWQAIIIVASFDT
ncbi:MAG: alpha/beta hydrolase [Thiotrichaceae bacterium]